MPLIIYTVNVPDRLLFSITMDDATLAGCYFYGYEGNIPPAWIERDYLKMEVA